MQSAKWRIRFILALLVLGGLAAVGFFYLRSTPPSVVTAPGVAVPAGAPAEPAAVVPSRPQYLTVTLDARDGGAESGSAYIFDEGGQAKIVLSLTNAPLDLPQPADVVLGSCEVPGPARFTLAPAMNGGSETRLIPSLDEFLALAPLAVRVKRSETDKGTIIACGSFGVQPGAVTAPSVPTVAAGAADMTATLVAVGSGPVLAGTASFSAVGRQTSVTLNYSGAPPDMIQPAALRSGDCAELGAVRLALAPAVNGISLSTLDSSIETLKTAGPLVVTISSSQAEPDVIVACGEVK